MSDAPALKDALDGIAVRNIAQNLSAVDPSFAHATFERKARRGLEKRELKARVVHIIDALHHTWARPFPEVAEQLVKVAPRWRRLERDRFDFSSWPIIDYVGVHGLKHPEVALQTLRALTKLFSAEFAIRPFLIQHEAHTLRAVQRWAKDPDEHVRRLVSEGTRPLLPWGQKLHRFVDNPEPGLKLLAKLKDDPSEYVRRSVANHLNDISKAHPHRVLDTLEAWLDDAKTSRNRQRREKISRHALRGLEKAGDPRALRLLGFDPDAKVQVSGFKLTQPHLRIGEALSFSFALKSRASGAQRVVVDYAVHYVKKDGSHRRKVFKLKKLDLAARETLSIQKKHAFRDLSTRTHHPGEHVLELQINGKSKRRVAFTLLPAA